MHIKIVFLSLSFALATIAFSGLNAQTGLMIQFADRNKSAFAISNMSKITFQYTNILLKQTSGETVSYPLTAVDKIYFGLYSDVNFPTSNKVEVYPNPTSNYLQIAELPEQRIKVDVYNLTGVLVLTALMNAVESRLDVSSLIKGVYIIKVADKSIKFNKI